MNWQARPPGSGEGRPEILPPLAADPRNQPANGDAYSSVEYQGIHQASSYDMAAEPAPRRRSRWASAPATYILLAINLLVFLPMEFRPAVEQWVLDHGANSGVAETGYGQWWRVVSSTFIHNGIIHFGTNMWCLWNLGLLGEPLLGSYGLLGVYLLTGIGGSLLSTAVHPDAFSVGASGAIFGLAGVLIMLLKSPLLPVPPQELQRLRRSVIWFAVVNFVIGGGISLAGTALQIDNMAHLGGFLTGLVLGVPLLPRIGAPRGQFLQRQRLAYGGGIFVLLLLAYGIYRNHSG
ncbi:MAG TPA: rhomboid family intramembrane serine protease [Acidisarcina sp.]